MLEALGSWKRGSDLGPSVRAAAAAASTAASGAGTDIPLSNAATTAENTAVLLSYQILNAPTVGKIAPVGL